MSRARPRRAAAIGDRLSEVLQDDLADIASTMDWIDAAPTPADEPPPPGQSSDADAAAAEPEPFGDPTLDLMLDDFSLAVDAMFSARDEVLSAQPATPEASADPGHGDGVVANAPGSSAGRSNPA